MSNAPPISWAEEMETMFANMAEPTRNRLDQDRDSVAGDPAASTTTTTTDGQAAVAAALVTQVPETAVDPPAANPAPLAAAGRRADDELSDEGELVDTLAPGWGILPEYTPPSPPRMTDELHLSDLQRLAHNMTMLKTPPAENINIYTGLPKVPGEVPRYVPPQKRFRQAQPTDKDLTGYARLMAGQSPPAGTRTAKTAKEQKEILDRLEGPHEGPDMLFAGRESAPEFLARKKREAADAADEELQAEKKRRAAIAEAKIAEIKENRKKLGLSNPTAEPSAKPRSALDRRGNSVWDSSNHAPILTAQQRRDEEVDRTIFVGNLSNMVDVRALVEHFNCFGRIEKATIVLDDEGNTRGFGFIRYTTVDSAGAAVLKMDLTHFSGKRISVAMNRLTKGVPFPEPRSFTYKPKAKKAAEETGQADA